MSYIKYFLVFYIFFATTNLNYSACMWLTNNPETTQKSFDLLLNNNRIKPCPNSNTDSEIRNLVKNIAFTEIYVQKKIDPDNLFTKVLEYNPILYAFLQINHFKIDELYAQELLLIYQQTHQDYRLLIPVQKINGNHFMIDHNARRILSHRDNPLLERIAPTENLFINSLIPSPPIIYDDKK